MSIPGLIILTSFHQFFSPPFSFLGIEKRSSHGRALENLESSGTKVMLSLLCISYANDDTKKQTFYDLKHSHLEELFYTASLLGTLAKDWRHIWESF